MVKENTMKQTEIGLLPEDWEVIRLGDYVSLKNGYAFPSLDFSDIGPIVMTPGNFRLEGGLKFNADKVIRFKGAYTKNMQFSNGDLVMVMTDLTPDCNLLGKAGIIDTDEVVLHNQRIGKIECSKNVHSKYLSYYFNSETFSARMKNTATGSTVRHTSTPTIKNTILSLPPLTEQEAIAEALSDADAWIERLEQLIAKKRLIKQGAMQELLTPKEDWEVKKLGEVCSILNNLRIPIKESSRIKGDTPYYGANGIQGYIEGFTHNGDYVLVAEDGANDLNNYPINYVSGKIWVNNHAHVLQGILSILNTRFLSYLLKSIDFQNVLVGGTRAKLNKSILEKIEFSIPSLTEQTRIATILSDMDAELEALEGQLGKAKKVKQGMMQELLTGRVRLV